ncbi:MAG: hypothetical protein K0B02_05085 [DPANN group archaeon]|nr:hypothetical protein [DPANN group archaeon]
MNLGTLNKINNSDRILKKKITFAKNEGLLICGGSDFHYLNKNEENVLGKFSIPYEYLEKIKEANLKHNR